MSDDNKQTVNTIPTTLPKPMIATSDGIKMQPEDPNEKENVLPMPVAFGDDEELEEETKNNNPINEPPLQLGIPVVETVVESQPQSVVTETVPNKLTSNTEVNSTVTATQSQNNSEGIKTDQQHKIIKNSDIPHLNTEPEPKKPDPINIQTKESPQVIINDPAPITTPTTTQTMEPIVTPEVTTNQSEQLSNTPVEINTLVHTAENNLQTQTEKPVILTQTPVQVVENPESNSPKKSGKLSNLIIAIIASIVGILVLIGGVYAAKYFIDKSNKENKQPPTSGQTTPIPPPTTPKPTPVPTPEPEIDLSTLKVKVLNGSGIKGEASRASSMLKDMGFEDIKVGNADNFEYIETEISYKPDYENLIEKISQEADGKYDIVKGEELKETNKYDLIITLGDNSNKKDDNDQEEQTTKDNDTVSTDEDEV